MENENKVEETTETNDELEESTDESQEEETNEETEEEQTEDDTPSSDDYEKLQKELQTLKAQKDHWRKKATSKPKNEEIKKSNVSEEDLIRTARIASKLDDDDLEMLSSLNGSLQEKLENPLFKAYKYGKAKKLKSESASLKPSSGAKASKAKANMTAEEHKKWVKSLMS